MRFSARHKRRGIKRLRNGIQIFPIAIGLLVFGISCSEVKECEILFINAKIYDGLGNEAKVGNIAINQGEIIAVGRTSKIISDTIIDLEGLSIAPGFIDLHAHIEPLPIIPEAQSAIRMGVTTALGGPDGGSPLRIGNYLDTLEKIGVNFNVAYLIGHNAIRAEVLGLENRAPTVEELETMKELVHAAMREGAFGISTGLKYLPGSFSQTDEIIEVSKPAAELGGIYTSHLREEGLGLIEGVREAITIAEKAEIPVILTHHKAMGHKMWGASEQTLAMVDSAREAGLDVMVDQYPYTASSTSLSTTIPPWALEGGRIEAFRKREKDPILRDSIKKGIIYNLLNDRGGGDLKRIQLSNLSWKPHLAGKTLYDWALEEGMEPNAENGAELIIQAQIHGSGTAIYHLMDEIDVERIMQHPQTMIASDGRLTNKDRGFSHPRAYGTFPRVLGYYVREKGVLKMSEAVKKMTSMPADRLGLTDRGRIQKGAKADLVIFDPASIIDKATFTDPHQFPEGIFYVLVNGKIVVERGAFNDIRAGKILRGPGYENTQR